MINRSNYESFIVDFVEGNLSSQLAAEMELFLQANPDVRNEVDLFQESNLKDEVVNYPGKVKLKQIPFEKTDIHSEYFQQQCIDFIEGFMTESEKALFLEMVSADELKMKELESFQKTVLIPKIVSFNEKILLKRNEPKQVINHENFEMYCVAFIEGWLDEEGTNAFNKYVLMHPENQKTLDQFLQTRLIPDNSITYPNKRQLKQFVFPKMGNNNILTYASSAAAILIFGVMLFYSSQFTNKLQLTGSLINNPDKVASQGESKTNPVKEEAAKKAPVQNQLAVFSSYTNRNSTKQEVNNSKQPIEKKVMHPINPIMVNMLECPPCKQFLIEGKEIKVNQAKELVELKMEEKLKTEAIESGKKTGINAKIRNLATAGISEISKLTNTEIVVRKEDKQKTKIAFNSRYFAFSTTVDNKQKNY